MRTLVILLAALLMAAPAQAQPRQTASLTFTSMKPGAPTGAVLDVDYFDPANPQGKPPRVTRVVTTLAPGSRYDTSVPAQCEASDAELHLLGATACPPESVVGTGSLTVDTGAGDSEVDVTFLNRTDELIFLNTVRDTFARTVLRAPISGTTLTSDVPMLPGTPPDGGVLDRSHFVDFTVGRYITTPPACPKAGHWVNTTTFTYADGVTQTVQTRSPCTKPKPKPRKRKRSRRRG
jgi:hypothetical protein